MDIDNISRRRALGAIAALGTAALSYTVYKDTNGGEQLDIDDNDTDQSQPDLTETEATPDESSAVDIRNHGGSVDGKTDDSAALLKSIDAAQPGGTVALPEGDILLQNGKDEFGSIHLAGNKYDVTITGRGPDKTSLIINPGHRERHALFRFSDDAKVDINIKGVTIDGNAPNQISGVGHAIVSDGASGVLRLRDTVIQNTLYDGIRLSDHVAADIRHCSFLNCGDPKFGSTHAISPNQQSAQTTNIVGCLFRNSAASDIDVGFDGSQSLQTVNIDSCYSEESPRFVKLDPTNKLTKITNSRFIGGSGSLPSLGVVANNDDYQCGSLELDKVAIENCEKPGLDLGAGTNIAKGALKRLKIGSLLLKDVDKSNSRSIKDRTASGIYAEGTNFVQSGTIYIYNVGANNDGDAIWFREDCTGSIDRVFHNGTSSIGEPDGVKIGRNLAGAAITTVDIPTKADVGPRTGSS